jgi:uncharacterized surface protein with fasciclin (FAS1) repeats
MRKIAAGVAAAASLTLIATGAGPAAAAEQPLSAVLTSDGNTFDRNGKDFDIVTEAVLAVLDAKPDSTVGVLTDGSVRLTAFVPNDAAFKKLATDLTGKKMNERRTFATVAGLGIDTVEDVLLYHVVPGATIRSKVAFQSDGARLKTALGKTVKVNVEHGQIRLLDKDRNSRNATVVVKNVNRGNKQIAHGIDRVLRPLDLPPTANH